MKRIYPILLLLAFTFSSCQSLLVETVKIAPRQPDLTTNVKVIPEEKLPDNAILIGKVIIGDKGFTSTKKCTYEKCIEAIMKETRNLGGNIIVEKRHQNPGEGGFFAASTCHKVDADIYYVPNE